LKEAPELEKNPEALNNILGWNISPVNLLQQKCSRVLNSAVKEEEKTNERAIGEFRNFVWFG
jgi:hypothetical protein